MKRMFFRALLSGLKTYWKNSYNFPQTTTTKKSGVGKTKEISPKKKEILKILNCVVN